MSGFQFEIGQRFFSESERRWRSFERKGNEKRREVIEVTELRNAGFSYAVREVVSVADPLPGTEAGTFLPDGRSGGMTFDYARQLLKAGTLSPVLRPLPLRADLAARAAATPLWQLEFGAEYAVPDGITAAGLTDISWHNDVCPSFTHPDVADRDEIPVRLWVEHPDPDKREFASGERFAITWGDNEDGGGIETTDDLDAALQLFAAKVAEAKAVQR